MKAHLNGTAEKYEAEYRILSPADGYKWYRGIGRTVLWDTQGVAIKVTGITIDITANKQHEQEQHEMGRMA